MGLYDECVSLSIPSDFVLGYSVVKMSDAELTPAVVYVAQSNTAGLQTLVELDEQVASDVIMQEAENQR